MPRPRKPWFHDGLMAFVTKIDGKPVPLAPARSAKDREAKKRADVALRRLMAERDGGVPAPPGDIKLWALLDLFLESLDGRVAPLTRDFYHRHIRSFNAFMGPSRTAMSVTDRDVEDWLARGWRKRRPAAPGERGEEANGRVYEDAIRPYSQASRCGAIVAVKAAFNWAAKKRRPPLIPSNPIADVKAPPMPRRDAVLDEPTVRRIIGASRGPFRDLIAFMWETGCRPSEATDLEAGHVVAAEGIVRMPSKTTRATGKDRTIYLNDAAMAILRRNLDRHPDGRVFRNARGNPWHRHAMASQFGRLRAKLGLGADGTAEAIRHAFGTDGALHLKPMVLAELMGHTSTAMVDKYYTHLDRRREEMRRAAGEVRGGLEIPGRLAVGAADEAADPGRVGRGGRDDEPGSDVGV